MIEILKIVQYASIIVACWQIISGVGAWKREFIGKRKIELAEDTLATFLEIKDAIAEIRNPYSSIGEGSTRQPSESETEADKELLDRGYIVHERYEMKKDIFVKFSTLKYRFMAVFGSETKDIFTEINHTVKSILISANKLATYYWKRQGKVQMEDEEFQSHLDEMHRHEGIFWDTNDEDDEIRVALSKIQLDLESVIKPCFEEPMSTYAIATKKLNFGRTKSALSWVIGFIVICTIVVLIKIS